MYRPPVYVHYIYPEVINTMCVGSYSFSRFLHRISCSSLEKGIWRTTSWCGCGVMGAGIHPLGFKSWCSHLYCMGLLRYYSLTWCASSTRTLGRLRPISSSSTSQPSPRPTPSYHDCGHQRKHSCTNNTPRTAAQVLRGLWLVYRHRRRSMLVFEPLLFIRFCNNFLFLVINSSIILVMAVA